MRCRKRPPMFVFTDKEKGGLNHMVGRLFLFRFLVFDVNFSSFPDPSSISYPLYDNASLYRPMALLNISSSLESIDILFWIIFGISKIICIFLIFFIEEYQIRGMFFVKDIFWKLEFLKQFVTRIMSWTSNIAFLMDWAQMSDIDFGLIRQNISNKNSIIKGALFLWKVATCD